MAGAGAGDGFAALPGGGLELAGWDGEEAERALGGPRGRVASLIEIPRKSPGIEDIGQMHLSETAGELNSGEESIANLESSREWRGRIGSRRRSSRVPSTRWSTAGAGLRKTIRAIERLTGSWPIAVRGHATACDSRGAAGPIPTPWSPTSVVPYFLTYYATHTIVDVSDRIVPVPGNRGAAPRFEQPPVPSHRDQRENPLGPSKRGNQPGGFESDSRKQAGSTEGRPGG